MTNTTKYSKVLSDFVLEIAKQYETADDGFTTSALIDSVRHHYQSIVHGFREHKRFYTVQFHFEIIEEKVWIQRDITDTVVSEELVKRGIPSTDIVLAYKPESSRYWSGYGVDFVAA